MGEETGRPAGEPEIIAVEAEPVGPPRRTRPVVAVVATVTALVVVAAIVAVGVHHDGGSKTSQNAAALGLSRTSGGGGVPAFGGVAPMPYPYSMTPHYVLDGALPDLGTHASVYTLDEPTIDHAYVAKMAAALDVRGTVQNFGQTYTTSSSNAHLVVESSAVPFVEFNELSSGFAPPSAIGSTGGAVPNKGFGPLPAIGGGTGGALGVSSSGQFSATPTTDTSTTSTTPTTASTTSTTVPGPSIDDARKAATDVLTRMGVLGDASNWDITVGQAPSGVISGAGSCRIGATCAEPPVVAAAAQTVSFTRAVNGTTVHGLQWTVQIGQHNSVELVSGTLGTPSLLGDYPLRPTSAVWGDVTTGNAQLVGGMNALRLGGYRGLPTPAVPVVPQIGSNRKNPTTPIAPTPPIVHVTGATLGLAVWRTNQGAADVVPTYRFATRDAAGDTGEIEAVALPDDAFGPTPTTTTPPTFVPLPSPGPPTSNVPGQAPPDATVRVEITVGSDKDLPTNETAKVSTYDMTRHLQISETTLPLVVGATTTLFATPGRTSLQLFGAPKQVHAELQFDAGSGDTVQYVLAYGGGANALFVADGRASIHA
jgi:hypothetical protein